MSERLDIVLWAPSSHGGLHECEVSVYQDDGDHVMIRLDCGYDDYAAVRLDRERVGEVVRSLQAWLGGLDDGDSKDE
jgi:hypothetical protein